MPNAEKLPLDCSPPISLLYRKFLEALLGADKSTVIWLYRRGGLCVKFSMDVSTEMHKIPFANRSQTRKFPKFLPLVVIISSKRESHSNGIRAEWVKKSKLASQYLLESTRIFLGQAKDWARSGWRKKARKKEVNAWNFFLRPPVRSKQIRPSEDFGARTVVPYTRLFELVRPEATRPRRVDRDC